MEAIRKQVEFYFSDANYRKDTFLRCAAENDAEGFVPISTLLTFNKLKALTQSEADVATALKDSTEVIVSEDGSRIRRKDALPENDTSRTRTLYVKGYPIDDPKVTIESIQADFSIFGKVLMVRCRKDPHTKKFKGSCFIEFSAEEEMKNAVDTTNKNPEDIRIPESGVKFDCVLTLSEWLERKENKRKLLKEKKAEEKKGQKREREDDDEGENEGEEKKSDFTAGLIFKITNVPPGSSLNSLKDTFKAKAEVKFVDFGGVGSIAFVRVASPEAAKAIQDALTAGLKISGSDVNLEGMVLEGEEESAYWSKIIDQSKRNTKGPPLLSRMFPNVNV